MTTEINKQPGLPASEYVAHVERVLREAQSKHARRRTLALYMLAVVVGALAMLVLPGYVMAFICLGAPSAMLGYALFSSYRESREYNQEHDLP